MGEKRKPGERLKEGETRKEILLLVFNHPEGVDEPDIRDAIREKTKIRTRDVITAHLKKLQDQGFIQKIQAPRNSGKPNRWKPSEFDFSVFSKIFADFPTNDHEAFFSTEYVQGVARNTFARVHLYRFYVMVKAEEELLLSSAARIGLQTPPFPSLFEYGLDFERFFTASYQLSPSLTIDKCLRNRQETYSKFHIASVLLSHSQRVGGCIVTSHFDSIAGRGLFFFLVYLLSDAEKYPQRQKEIFDFLNESNTLKFLNLIVSDPTELQRLLFINDGANRQASCWDMEEAPDLALDLEAHLKELMGRKTARENSMGK